MQDIYSLGVNSYALGMNDRGLVVGYYSDSSLVNHAFVYDGTSMVDLNTLIDPASGWNLSVAHSVNNKGVIAGEGYHNNTLRGFVLYPAQYKVTDLGTLGGTTSIGLGVSPTGSIAGAASTATATHAYRTAPDAAIAPANDLGTLGGANSEGNAINTKGLVAGDAMTASGDTHAFLYPGHTPLQDLGTLGGPQSIAYGINDAKTVVGYSQLTGGTSAHGFEWKSVGGMKDLPALGGQNSSAHSINTAGLAVGYADTASASHIALWTSTLGVVDLGTLGGLNGQANHISDNNQVVGQSSVASGDSHAFTLNYNAVSGTVSGLTDLGTFGGAPSVARSVNNFGRIVGEAADATSVLHPFVSEKGVTLDLGVMLKPGAGWTLTSAQAVNDRGEIVGDGVIGGKQHAYLLQPLATPLDSTVSVSSSPLVFNSTTNTWNATITVTNNGTVPAVGPLQLLLTGLSAGTTLVNGSGTVNGAPYISANVAAIAPTKNIKVLIKLSANSTYTVQGFTGVFGP